MTRPSPLGVGAVGESLPSICVPVSRQPAFPVGCDSCPNGILNEPLDGGISFRHDSPKRAVEFHRQLQVHSAHIAFSLLGHTDSITQARQISYGSHLTYLRQMGYNEGVMPFSTEPVLKRVREYKQRWRKAACGIYLMRAADGSYKIGRSWNVYTRYYEHCRDREEVLELVHIVHCEDEQQDAERWFHGIFADQRLHGEWFRLTEEDIAWFVSLQTWE